MFPSFGLACRAVWSETAAPDVPQGTGAEHWGWWQWAAYGLRTHHKSCCSVFIAEACLRADEVNTSFERHGSQNFNSQGNNVYAMGVSPVKCSP